MESEIQALTVTFCKSLPSFVEQWSKLLEDSGKHAKVLSNYGEQLRHVENAKVESDLQDLREKLLYKIYVEVDEEIVSLKQKINQLNQSYQDLKNRLTHLESSTVELNWSSDTPLISGSAFQPALSTILQDSYDFIRFFTEALKNINEQFKLINLRDEKQMGRFIGSFRVGLDGKEVNHLLAIVQYVGNEKAVT